MRLPVVAMLLSAAMPGAALAQPANPLDPVFADIAKPDGPGCAVAVSRAGKVIASGAYGARDVGTGAPITVDTVFDTASISKQFTAFSILLLESRGKLSIDDSIVNYVPELGEAARPVTLRHLIHHLGGIRDHLQIAGLAGARDEADPHAAQALEILARQKGLAFKPGTVFSYSNSGYFLLAVTVERVAKTPFRTFLKREIFTPFGMNHTDLMEGGRVTVDPVARGYQVKKDGSLEISESRSDVPGPGGIYSTVGDLLRWRENYRTAKVGGRGVIDAMARKGVLGDGTVNYYASGLGVEKYRGLATVGHGGAWRGYRGQFQMFPEQDLAIAVLCNRTDAWPNRRAEAVAEIWLESAMGPKGAPAKAAALVPGIEDLTVVPAGAYRNEVNGSYLWLTGEGGKLTIQLGSLSAPLTPVTPGVFGFNFGSGWRYVAFDPVEGGMLMRAPFYGDPPLFRKVAAWKLDDPARYAGIYRSDEVGADFELRAVDGGLALMLEGKPLQLRAGAPGDLEAGSPGNYMIVVPVEGAADHFILRDSSLGDIRFNRK